MKLAKDNFNDIDKKDIEKQYATLGPSEFKDYCTNVINNGRSVGSKKQHFLRSVSNDKLKNLTLMYNFILAGEGLGVV